MCSMVVGLHACHAMPHRRWEALLSHHASRPSERRPLRLLRFAAVFVIAWVGSSALSLVFVTPGGFSARQPEPRYMRGQTSIRQAFPALPQAAAGLDALIAEAPALVITKAACPFCRMVRTKLDNLGAVYEVLELEDSNRRPLVADVAAVQDLMAAKTGARTVPRVFVGGAFVGGCDQTLAKAATGELARLLEAAGAVEQV